MPLSESGPRVNLTTKQCPTQPIMFAIKSPMPLMAAAIKGLPYMPQGLRP